MKKCFVFPGQGSQSVGMGKELYDNFSVAKDVFNEVDDALGAKLSDIIFGDETALGMTENTQPALMAVSVATARVIEELSGKKLTEITDFVAGHSLGEYSSLASIGVIAVSDTAKVLRLRGQAMQDAVPQGVGGMAAVLGIDYATAEKLSAEVSTDTHKCWVANDNIEGQLVLSGHIQAIDKVVEVAKEYGAKRALKLPVSAPFHCELIKPAMDKMAVELNNITFNNAGVPVITNVTAQPQTDAETIKNGLIEQVCGRVRWRETIGTMINDLSVSNLVECGAGKVLSGMVKRIDGIEGISLNTTEEIEEFVKTL
ncbi:MAG: ACP S-malonyltransferase [Alphaproteobacteria bacterium]